MLMAEAKAKAWFFVVCDDHVPAAVALPKLLVAHSA